MKGAASELMTLVSKRQIHALGISTDLVKMHATDQSLHVDKTRIPSLRELAYFGAVELSLRCPMVDSGPLGGLCLSSIELEDESSVVSFVICRNMPYPRTVASLEHVDQLAIAICLVDDDSTKARYQVRKGLLQY